MARQIKMLTIALLFVALLAPACGKTSTPDLERTVEVAVAATQAALLTETVASVPTSTPTLTTLPTATPTPIGEDTPTRTLPSPTPTATRTPRPTATPTLPSPPTATSVSEPTATPVPPPTATPTLPSPPTATPIPTSVPTPTPTDTPRPSQPSRLYAVVDVANDEELNVRLLANPSSDIVGAIPFYGLDVEVTGPGAQVGGGLWVPVVYQDVTGWVNSRYLARQQGWVNELVAARAAEIVTALKNWDTRELTAYVHPEQGLRFSPYTYVRAGQEPPENQDLVFPAEHIWDFFSDYAVYHWGWFDGSGEPIEMTFEEYYGRFIYDVDFCRPDIVSFVEFVGWGNTVNNIQDVYPDAVTIEYHFEGLEPAYAGMDWRSLRLVLEELDGTWYLVGIVHDEWTT